MMAKRKRTGNMMAKRRRTNNDQQNTPQTNYWSRTTNPNKNRGWTHVHRKNKQFLFHTWHPFTENRYWR